MSIVAGVIQQPVNCRRVLWSTEAPVHSARLQHGRPRADNYRKPWPRWWLWLSRHTSPRYGLAAMHNASQPHSHSPVVTCSERALAVSNTIYRNMMVMHPDRHAFGCVGRSLISSSLIPKAQRQGGHHFVWLGIADPKWSDDLPVVPSNLQGVRPVVQIMDCIDVWEWLTEFVRVLEDNVDLWEFLDSSITFRATAILYHRHTNLNSWIQV